MLMLATLHIFTIFCALLIMLVRYWRVLDLLQSIARHVV